MQIPGRIAQLLGQNPWDGARESVFQQALQVILEPASLGSAASNQRSGISDLGRWT